MFKFLKFVLSGQNQFASGGLLLMAIGSIGAMLRAVPAWLWDWIVRQTTMTISVTNDDVAFRWIKEWFLEQKFLKRVRHVDLDTTLRGAVMAMIPAPGHHRFIHAGRPFEVWFSRSEDTKGYTPRRVESLTFRTIGRDRAFLQRFVEDIVACHRRKESVASYLYLWDQAWECVEAYCPRLLDSVILKPGEKEHVLADVNKFRASKQRYRQLGVPYHRGYLFYGPPGSGKTSLVSALANHFGLSIYLFNLSELNDRTLRSAMSAVPENSLVLFEDIDCMKAGNRRADMDSTDGRQPPARTPEKNAPDGAVVTLSGLLNVLDGFQAPENVIFAMTTNRAGELDPALLRPGRIDYRLYMGEASEWQRIELYRRFFPDSVDSEVREFVQAHTANTMAEFQGQLLALEQDWTEMEMALNRE
jgi:mitochondrial chaperone BCS1